MTKELNLDIWLSQITHSLANGNSKSCVDLLDVDKTQIPQEHLNFLSHKETKLHQYINHRSSPAFPIDHERAPIAKFLQGFLLYSKLLTVIQTNPEEDQDVTYPLIFQLFLSECYQIFYRELIPTKKFDGMWVAPIIDHLSAILCKLAVVADDSQSSKDDKNTFIDEFDENNGQSNQKFIEIAQ